MFSNGDVYLHNPRGNNNRCDERSNNRNNANRLFDSQNNAAGGYAIGCNRPENAQNDADITCYKMKYYTNTIIPMKGGIIVKTNDIPNVQRIICLL